MSKRHSEDQNEELWDLELYGAPTYGPGLS